MAQRRFFVKPTGIIGVEKVKMEKIIRVDACALTRAGLIF